MNTLENLLRKWTPRRPSARLKTRIFTPNTLAPSAIAEFKPQWGWLAPAAGALLLTLLVSSSSWSHLSSTRTGRPTGLLASVGVSNMSDLRPYLSQSEGEHNVLTTILEWTNTDYSPSSIGSLLLYTTNSLRN